MNIRPKNSGPEVAIEKITALLLAGKSRPALAAARAALAQFPQNAGVHTRLADALYSLGQIPDAEKHYRRALELDPAIFQAHYGLGWSLRVQRRFAEATQSFEQALSLEAQTGDADARLALAGCRFAVGDIDAAIADCEHILAQPAITTEQRAAALLEIAKISPGSSKRGNDEILKARVAFSTAAHEQLHTHEKPSRKSKSARIAAKPLKAPLASPRQKPQSKSRLRIGYISAFFGSRNWMKPVFGVINEHDRAAFDIHLLCDDEKPSAASGYRRHRDDVIHHITGSSNDEAAALIKKLGIDILVDLNGYSYKRRLGLMLRKPARLQVGWFNTFATSGMRSYDCIVGDEAVIPKEEDEFYTEKILRVPGTYLAFNVQYETPDIGPSPAGAPSARALTFGCLAPQYKITPDVISTWAEILKASAAPRLILRNTYLGDEKNRDEIHARFAKAGVAAERVTLYPPVEHFEFLKTYDEIDVALDTFPYSGGTTTMEALWQGVPVLTFEGDRWASRTSKSILLAARMDDWVLRSRESYIKRATDLARSERTPAMLAMLRREMRWGLVESAACDTPRLSLALEGIYRKLAQ